MAASLTLSSPRVAPRSVIRVAATSAMTFSMVSASERTAAVHDASQTAGVLSDADTVEKVIAEVAATRITERGATRADDRISEAGMEDRKRLGYF